MKIPHTSRLIVLATIVLIFITISASAQIRNTGEVVGLVDGKTVIVSIPTGRLTVELQYIDVPEPSQDLHAVVKAHVTRLLVGKAVELETRGFTRGTATAKLVLNGVDVSQQLLRDGAAWHVPIEVSAQNKAEFDAYAESESLARQEKRGVWSIATLEPSWQFRRRQQYGDSQPVSSKSNGSNPAARKKGYWSDENPRLKDPGGITYGFNAKTQTGFLGTPLLGVRDEMNQIPGQKLAVDLTYFYTEKGEKGRTGYFEVTLVSLADDWKFLRLNTLTVQVDGKNFVVGKPKRETGKAEFKQMEKLTYRVDVAMVEKIAHGADVQLKIGADYRIIPRPGLQMVLYSILQAAK